jgi:hypothetical protein
MRRHQNMSFGEATNHDASNGRHGSASIAEVDVAAPHWLLSLLSGAGQSFNRTDEFVAA